MKKLFLLLLAFVAASALKAEDYILPAGMESYTQRYDFVENGIYYHIFDEDLGLAEVMNENPLKICSVSSDRLSVEEIMLGWKGDAYSGKIEIPQTVEYQGRTYMVSRICMGAFAKCTALESVKLPATIRSIRPAAFFGCTALTDINIPDGTQLSAKAFSGCKAIKSLDLTNLRETPQNQTYLYSGWTDGCSSLEEIWLPAKDMESIAYVINPDGMDALTRIHAPWINPQKLNIDMNTPREDAVLYVPEGTKEKYAGQFPWDMFSKIVEEPARPGAGVKAPAAAPTEGAEAEYFTTAGVRAGAFASRAEAAAKLPAGIYICRSAAGTASKIIIR